MPPPIRPELDAHGHHGAATLIQRIAQRRDREAFTALFRQYAPRVKGHLVGRGVARGVAEEITQEVMLAVWSKAATFDPARGTAPAWIFTIARNTLVSHLRRAPRPEVEPDDPAAVPPAADEALIGEETRRALGAALHTLPPEQAEVIDAAYFGDRSFGQVAADKRLPLGTVKTRARLAVERLRALFTRGEGR